MRFSDWLFLVVLGVVAVVGFEMIDQRWHTISAQHNARRIVQMQEVFCVEAIRHRLLDTCTPDHAASSK